MCVFCTEPYACVNMATHTVWGPHAQPSFSVCKLPAIVASSRSTTPNQSIKHKQDLSTYADNRTRVHTVLPFSENTLSQHPVIAPLARTLPFSSPHQFPRTKVVLRPDFTFTEGRATILVFTHTRNSSLEFLRLISRGSLRIS